MHVDGQTRLAELAHQPVELAESRLRRKRQELLTLAHHAQQAPQLQNGVARRRLDRAHGLPGLLGLALHQLLCRGGLHAHHADAVRDDVVELACDPRALLDDGGTGPLLPIALEPHGAVAQLVALEPPPAHVASQQPGAAAEEEHEEGVRDHEHRWW